MLDPTSKEFAKSVIHIVGLAAMQIILLVICSILKDIRPAVHNGNVDITKKYEHIGDKLVLCEVKEDNTSDISLNTCDEITEGHEEQKSPVEIVILLHFINIGIVACILKFISKFWTTDKNKFGQKMAVGVGSIATITLASIIFAFNISNKLHRWDEFVLTKNGTIGGEFDYFTITVSLSDRYIALDFDGNNSKSTIKLNPRTTIRFDTNHSSLTNYELKFYEDEPTIDEVNGTEYNTLTRGREVGSNCEFNDGQPKYVLRSLLSDGVTKSSMSPGGGGESSYTELRNISPETTLFPILKYVGPDPCKKNTFLRATQHLYFIK